MSEQYMLTGIIYEDTFKPKYLSACFANSTISGTSVIQVTHAQYSLCFEGNLISAQATDYRLLSQGLEDCLQRQKVAYMFDVFEVDGRLVARFQG